MSRKANTPKFNISTPDIRTIYLGHGAKQRVRYIQLRENFGKEIFEEDIKAGATIYKPMLDILGRKTTQYNIITAPTEEDGLRAVQYLAGVYAREDMYGSEDVNVNAYSDAGQKSEYDIEDDGLEFVFNEDDEYFYDDEIDPEEYQESFDRIPVINISEVSDLENEQRSYEMGNYRMESQNNAKPPKRWWLACEEESICVIKNSGFDGFFATEAIGQWEISCLRRFGSNAHVYVLVINDDIKEDDYSITSFMLEYTANSFRIDNAQDKREIYYRNLLCAEAGERGFKFAKSVDVALLAERLSKIDYQHPCEKFKQIMDYMVHLGAPHTLRSEDFDSMGLAKLIERMSGDPIKTLESELVGMESVKRQVNNIMNMLRYVKLRAKRGVKTSEYHNVHLFIGAPGTAKTTVAKVMAKMMQNEGLLRGTRFISITGAQLKGAYVGQTAPKVHAIFEEHDAIFIDEAYSLTSGSESIGGMDPYAEEALAQLAVELEEHSTDKLVIFAGYGGKRVSSKNNLMNRFLKSNPGISSRINSTIYFDSYSAQEMVDIIHGLAKKKELSMAVDGDTHIAEYFETRRKDDDFGNGREARVLLEQCERHVAQRIADKINDDLSDEEIATITVDDIKASIDDLKARRTDELGENGRAYGVLGKGA